MSESPHPHYGPCDGFADGECSECVRLTETRNAEEAACRCKLTDARVARIGTTQRVEAGRVVEEKAICGVCGGVAWHLPIDRKDWQL